jgi:hypothetical protein
MAPAAATTTYQGTFQGRAEEIARVRREMAAYLGQCPVADDMVLVADELASNSVLHTRSRGGTFHVRCELSPGSARVEVEDTGGPWRTRTGDDRPHGLNIVQALTGADGWGTEQTRGGTRLVWASLRWPDPLTAPGHTKMDHMRDTWETTVRTAAATMLRYPDKLSDGLESELYVLLERLGPPETGRPESTGTPDDAT